MKILRGLALTFIIILMSIFLIACDNDKDTAKNISMRVGDGYIQWRVGDSGNWNNLIAVNDLKGSNGLGISSITINNNSELVIRYTDGTDQNLGKIKGSDGVGLQSVSINSKGELIIKLTNNNEINAGKVVGKDGREVEIDVIDGYIKWRYVGETEWKNLVALSKITGPQGPQGQDGVGIQTVVINDEGELLITLTSGTTLDLGKVVGNDGQNGQDGVGIAEIEVDENGNLIITLTNGQSINAGKVVGRDGKDGREVEIDVIDGYIKWRYVGETEWIELISLEELIGEKGIDGTDGKSAYEIYLIYHPEYTGNETQWIDDLINGRLAVQEKVTITFVLNGGTGIETLKVVKGLTAELPLPERPGYTFLGWYSNDEDTVFDGRFTNYIPVVRDITLYARWEKIPLEGIKIIAEETTIAEDTTLQIEVEPLPNKALLPKLVWESSDPTVASVDENGLVTAHKVGKVTITVKTEDDEFTDTVEITVLDIIKPEFKGIELAPGLIILKDGETFKLIIKAFDKNLYELEFDHSLENELPEFSVYASEENPYGTDIDRDKFEEAGVSVEYDAETQTWTIDFGTYVTNIFLTKGKVTFYMVLVDESGNKWGSMSPTTPENTFKYEFISYKDYALQQILAAKTYEEMKAALIEYQDALTIDDAHWDLFNQLPEDERNQQAIIQYMIDAVENDMISNLTEVAEYFNWIVEKEALKVDFVKLINEAEDAEAIAEILESLVPLLHEQRDKLIDLYPELEEAVYTIVLAEINEMINENDEDRLMKIANKLLAERATQVDGQFADEEAIAASLKGIINGDLDNPQLVDVKPEKGKVIIIKDGTFKWIIQASDANLYELEVDHSLEGILPEFSVYANAENPYGTEEARALFESYGVIVEYDEETQTWTIDFGHQVTRKFIQAGQVSFYIVIKDINGYTWGSMYNVTEENTFTYTFQDYYQLALEAVKNASSYTDMRDALIEYKDAFDIDEAIWDLFDALPKDQGRQQAIIGAMIAAREEIKDLDDVKQLFEFLTDKEYKKWVYIQAVDNAEDVNEMLAALINNIPELNRIRQFLINELGLDILEGKDYTTTLFDINKLIEENDQEILTNIAKRLLDAKNQLPKKRFFGTEAISEKLREILDSDLDAPKLVDVKPGKGGLIIVKPVDGFKWIIQASDANLYELEVDHSLEGILPGFSVYANAENPYGSEEARALFESYGVTVEYDEETQTWTITFKGTVLEKPLEVKVVTFYIVLKDNNGNTWGSMYDVTEENTFTYQFIDYDVYAYDQIVASEDETELRARIIEFRDAVQISDATLALFNQLPEQYKHEIIKGIMLNLNNGYITSLEGVKFFFDIYLNMYTSYVDVEAPSLGEVSPNEGLQIIKDTFKWIIKANDQYLYKLEIDHSLEKILPEFSVYASEENPYGTEELRAAFAEYGVTVTYDADTQTWTIEFGGKTLEAFLKAGTVRFYIVIHDQSGNTWGSMNPTTPENTFVYTFKTYAQFALEEILNAKTVEAMLAALIEYNDLLNISDLTWETYNSYETQPEKQVQIIAYLIQAIADEKVVTLEDVATEFANGVNQVANGEYQEFIDAINKAKDVQS